ncbi:MAG: XRE family transcriptional regulator [wastewater metagenome]|nr:XRE family transcriptional regulator [Candidatus Loosdrechtia aerotolerans]
MSKKNIVGNNIRKFRLRSGITQEELALMSGLSQGYINQLESGKRKYTQKSLELIAHAMSVPLVEFFTEKGVNKDTVVKETEGNYQKKKLYTKEFVQLLNGLPEHIIKHYLTLLKLERELVMKNRKSS